MPDDISKDVLNEKIINIERTLERLERSFENYRTEKRSDINDIHAKIDKIEDDNSHEHKTIFVEIGKLKTRVAIYAGVGAFIATIVIRAFNANP